MRGNFLSAALFCICAAAGTGALAISRSARELVPPHDLPWTPSVTNETKITSDKMDFDYRYNIATFLGNVVVRDPMFNAVADKAVVVFTTNEVTEVKSVVVTGNVRLRGVTEKGESVSATCTRAVYSGERSNVLMEGPPMPVVRYGNRVASGKTLILWIDDGRVEIPSDAAISVPSEEVRSGSEALRP